MHIALTGGIGTGKSTVLRLLAAQLPQYHFFSVDDAVRGLYANEDYRRALRERFGTDLRNELSDKVFAQPELRTQLEEFASSWVLPLLELALAHDNALVEFPLLYEMPGWADRFDFVIAVGCDEATQRARVLARDGMPEAKFEQIRSAQFSTARKAELADAYLDTGIELAALPARVSQVVQMLLERERLGV